MALGAARSGRKALLIVQQGTACVRKAFGSQCSYQHPCSALFRPGLPQTLSVAT